MIISYKVLDLKQKDEWKYNLSKLPLKQQDIYYTPEYYKLYEDLGDGTAKCFVFKEADSLALYPFLINSVNELGYDLDKEYYDIQGAYGYNGVVSNNFSETFRISFFKSFSNYCSENNIIAEFTRFHPILKNHNFSEVFLTVIKDRDTVFLDLSKTYDEIWANEYSSRNRNMIRKAQKKEFSTYVNEKPTLEDIKHFVNIYQTAMKAIIAEKYYFFNEEFFINTFESLGSSAVLFEVLNINRKIECAAIIFIYGTFAHYHLSGRIQDSNNSVNNFILDEAVKYAITKGIQYFHFGGGTDNSPDNSLLKFKGNFSSERGKFYIGKKVHNQNIYDEVIRQWETKNPTNNQMSKNILLRYRNI